jgi:hypothetical protein
MKNFLFLSALLFSVTSYANPFDYFAGTYNVVGPVEITNWNFPSCSLWNLQNTKAVGIYRDSTHTNVFNLAIDVGAGTQPVEPLGDFSCGQSCYYKTSSRTNPKTASGVFVPNSTESSSSRGIIFNEASNGFELFVADVRYDLTIEGHPRNAYCFYKMKLKKH